MASTNIDKSKMAFAGVDAGAKMFVELKGESGAAAAAIVKKQKRHAPCNVRLLAELYPYRMFHTGRACTGAVCWPCGD
jgi:hypothetical protein